MRMMEELKQLQDLLRNQQHAEVETLRQENEQLRQAVAAQEDLLTERDSALAERARALAERDEALAERDMVRVERDPAVAEGTQVSACHSPPSDQLEELRRTVELLRALLKEKDGFIEDLKKRAEARPAAEQDMEHYEAELSQFRRQLEADREKLSKEIE